MAAASPDSSSIAMESVLASASDTVAEIAASIAYMLRRSDLNHLNNPDLNRGKEKKFKCSKILDSEFKI